MQVTQTTLKVELTIDEANVVLKALIHDTVERAKFSEASDFNGFKENNALNLALVESFASAVGNKTAFTSTLTASGAHHGVAVKRKKRASITRFEDGAHHGVAVKRKKRASITRFEDGAVKAPRVKGACAAKAAAQTEDKASNE